MISLLLCALIGVNVINRVASKTCSNVVAARNNQIRYLLYLTLVGAVACTVFFALGGFRIKVTGITLLYAQIYSGVCVLSCICNMEAFKLANISGVVVLSSFGGLVATSLVGFFLFGEEIKLTTLLKIAIMLVAALLTFIDAKRFEGPSAKRKSSATLKLIIIILLLILAGSGNNIILKLYGRAEGVADINSMFFFTNAFQGALALTLFLLLSFKGRRDETVRSQFRDSLNLFSIIPILAIAASTFSSNVGSLLSAELIKLMDMSVYTPVSSAAAILAGFIASFIYRERHSVLFYLTAALSLAAVLI